MSNAKAIRERTEALKAQLQGQSGGITYTPKTETTETEQKNTGSNALYVLEKLGLGVMRGIEGLSDYVVGGVGDLFGADEFAERLMKNDWVNYGHADEWFNPGKGWQFAGDVASGVGNMLPSIGLSFIPGVGAAVGTTQFIGSAMGQATSEAVKKTGDLSGNEWLYGTASGALEGLIEKATGGIGGSQAGKVLGKQVGKSTLGKLGIAFAGEGAEEVASDVFNPLLERVTGVDETAKIDWAGMPRTFLVGGTTGAVMGGGRSLVDAAVSGGFNKAAAKDTAQELEQRKADNNLRQADDKKQTYTQEDINNTKASLSTKLQKMADDTRKQFIEKHNLGNQFNENGTVKENAPAPENYNKDSYSASLQGQESTLAFKPVAIGSKVADAAKKTMNALTKLTKGMTNIVLTDDALLADNGEEANGLYKDGVIYLKANASDYDKVKIVGAHEVIHTLEGTKEYNDLAKYVAETISNDPALQKKYNYEKYRAVYDSILQGDWSEITKDYQATTEIFADYLANEVLKNEESMRRVTARDANIIVKLYQWVKDAISRLGNSAEERKVTKEMRKMESLLSKALNAGRGGVSLESVEEYAKASEKESVKNAQSTKEKPAVKTTGKLATSRASLKPYSEKQKGNWANSKNIVIYENDSQLKNFIDKSLSDSQYYKKMYFGAIGVELANSIQKATGLNLENFNCSLASNEVRKILKDHGTEKTELPRGQRPVSATDLLNIPKIIQNSTNISLSPTLYEGKPVILFEQKNGNEKTTVVAIVSNKHLDLRVQTEYIGTKKEKTLATPEGANAPKNTPEANSGTGFSTPIISQENDLSSENAKKVEKSSTGRPSLDVDSLSDFPSIDKWFESLTVEELRELIDNDSSINDISEELNVEPSKLRILMRREGLGKAYAVDGKDAVMKQSRIDEAIEDSGASNPTYARRYITRISTKDFIDLTVRKDHVNREAFDKEVIGDHGSKMGEYDYEKALQTSRTPYLSIDKASGQVISHNGRHRIRALEKAGIQSVEIEVDFFDEDGRLIKYDAETIPKMAISSQFDTNIETTISNVIPLNESHRTDIEKAYGEKAHPKAGVRYSIDVDLDEKTTARVQTIVSDKKRSVQEVWDETIDNIKKGSVNQWIKAQIELTDEQAGILLAGRNVGEVLQGEVQRARSAKGAAINMLNNEQRDFSGKNRVGDSLNAIFAPIHKKGEIYSRDFNLYLLHQLNVDRMSAVERGVAEDNKAVFQEEVTAEFSKEKLAQLDQQYPEFKKNAEKVWKYSQNLLQYRVDAGLITQEQANQMTEMYPHYVPAFYEEVKQSASGASLGKSGVSVKTGIRSAKGSTGVADLSDVSTSMSKQTMAVIRAASINKVAEKLYDGAVRTNNFMDVELASREKLNDPDIDYDKEVPKDNQVFFYKDGERITLNVSEYVFVGFEGLTAGAQFTGPLTSLSAKAIGLFKKLVTSWNLLFSITNAVRDVQEAFFYSKYGAFKFLGKYGKSLFARRNDPKLKELWQQYVAMGGTSSGYFASDTGIYDNRSKPKKAVSKVLEMFDAVNNYVEQTPRFAEFVASVEAGNSLEQALYDSAEVTTNFSRGGRTAKKLNRCLVPFLNPSIQGWSKLWRSYAVPMDKLSANEIQNASKSEQKRLILSRYGTLIIKSIAVGIGVGLFNDMLYRWFDDDEDYKNLPLNIKENYYLIKIGKKFIKLPKGRVLALYGSMATRIAEYANGNEDALDAWDWYKSASSMVSALESASLTGSSSNMSIKDLESTGSSLIFEPDTAKLFALTFSLSYTLYKYWRILSV
jgi:gas vesicle protein